MVVKVMPTSRVPTAALHSGNDSIKDVASAQLLTYLSSFMADNFMSLYGIEVILSLM
jgi:hypothetical protein